MVPGDLGTKGGLRTDVHGRVLRDGRLGRSTGCTPPATSAARSWATPTPGPGATIGPAITFGYLAALHIAERARTATTEELHGAH